MDPLAAPADVHRIGGRLDHEQGRSASFRCKPARDIAIVVSNDSSMFSINLACFSSEACS